MQLRQYGGSSSHEKPRRTLVGHIATTLIYDLRRVISKKLFATAEEWVEFGVFD
jgi:hypothetical protein